MLIEYKHELDKPTARQRIDNYVDKLDNIQFAGGFAVEDLKKSWTEDEMQVSFNLKKSAIDRRVEGNIKLKDKIIIMDMEIPEIVRNFVTDANLESTIRRNLDTILK
jgi:hypothetical protein